MFFCAFSFVILPCSEKFNLVSDVTPRIFGFLMVGICVLLMVSLSVVFDCALSGEKSVDDDLVGFNCSSFSGVEWNSKSR